MTDWQVYDNAGDRKLLAETVCIYCRRGLNADAQYAMHHPKIGFYYACVECARERGKI